MFTAPARGCGGSSWPQDRLEHVDVADMVCEAVQRQHLLRLEVGTAGVERKSVPHRSVGEVLAQQLGMLADLLAGRPVVVPAWKLRGRTFSEAAQRILWLVEATDVLVHADDSATVA